MLLDGYNMEEFVICSVQHMTTLVVQLVLGISAMLIVLLHHIRVQRCCVSQFGGVFWIGYCQYKMYEVKHVTVKVCNG